LRSGTDAIAKDYSPEDQETAMDIIPALMFMTLGAVLLFAVLQFAYFLRKRTNRNAAKDALMD
jgi:hypothetical protein